MEVLRQRNVVPSMVTKTTCVFVLSLLDVRPGYCYTALTNGRCSNQLPQSITKMQCCCDVGRCWSPGVTVAPEMCPIRSTGKNASMVSVAIPMQPFQAHGSVCSTDPNDTQVNQQDSRDVKCGHGGILQRLHR